MNKICLDEYEYNRLKFLLNLTNNNNFQYISDNLTFFQNLGKKYKNLENMLNGNDSTVNILQNNKCNTNYEIICRNLEFFKIYKNYINKFKHIYGYTGLSGSRVQTHTQNQIDLEKKIIGDLYFLYLPFSRFLYKNAYLKLNHNNYKEKGVGGGVPLICGLQGYQGCGKTTLCEIIGFLVENLYELKTEFLSIDDLYKTYSELKDLKLNDPMFKYRGPPGTHDINLGLDTLEKVKNREIKFKIPRYNKSAHGGLGDRSENGKFIKNPIDVFIFEGWFLGAEPVEEKYLEKSQKDLDKLDFQKKINKLLYEYKPMWEYVDYWVILNPFKFKYSRKWRIEAEKKNKQGMKYKQLNEFIDYFWLSVPPELHLKNIEKNKNPILKITLDKYRSIYV
jgi:pantothenate kinase-related protein Tda10